jgi:hypothetical protein
MLKHHINKDQRHHHHLFRGTALPIHGQLLHALMKPQGAVSGGMSVKSTLLSFKREAAGRCGPPGLSSATQHIHVLYVWPGQRHYNMHEAAHSRKPSRYRTLGIVPGATHALMLIGWRPSLPPALPLNLMLPVGSSSRSSRHIDNLLKAQPIEGRRQTRDFCTSAKDPTIATRSEWMTP